MVGIANGKSVFITFRKMRKYVIGNMKMISAFSFAWFLQGAESAIHAVGIILSYSGIRIIRVFDVSNRP